MNDKKINAIEIKNVTKVYGAGNSLAEHYLVKLHY